MLFKGSRLLAGLSLMEASSVVCSQDSRALQNLGMMYRQVRAATADALNFLSNAAVVLQVGMISQSVRSIARAFQLNSRDPLAVVSLLEVIARERSIAIAEGINATAVTMMAKEFSDKGDIRATKALAELYNSGGHYGHARNLLVRALSAGNSSMRIEGVKQNSDPTWSAKCLLMNLAHAGEHPPPFFFRSTVASSARRICLLCVASSIACCSCGLGNSGVKRSRAGTVAAAG